jgi:hypothetical protein
MAVLPTEELTAASCREQAKQCRELAEHEMSLPHRTMLEHIGATWERIASDIDQRLLAESRQ